MGIPTEHLRAYKDTEDTHENANCVPTITKFIIAQANTSSYQYTNCRSF